MFDRQVLVTFGPDGAYGHPYHIAVSRFATAAVVCAADASYCIADEPELRAHPVEKLFYLAWRNNKWAAYQTIRACVCYQQSRGLDVWPVEFHNKMSY